MTIKIDENVRLELTAEKHAVALYDAVDKNRKHLSQFLPWIENMQFLNDFHYYIENCELLYRQGKEVSFVIISNEDTVGRIGLHYINIANKNAAIGYWLTENAEGRGIITKSCEALINYGFENLDLHRIEIKAAAENLRSRAIPEKFHFTKEGILRQAECVNNRFLDIVLYSLLKDEWKQFISR
ncbi:MAG: GNAT family N-acetyltransferase [Ginsengibacter sp.]